MSDPAKRAAERIADDISEDNEREAWIEEAADIIRAEYRECEKEYLEREAAAVQVRDRQWCSELAKQGVAARAVYPGGIEVEVPTIAEAVEMEKCPSCGHDLAALGKD